MQKKSCEMFPCFHGWQYWRKGGELNNFWQRKRILNVVDKLSNITPRVPQERSICSGGKRK
jgi:hypothetical protein